MELIRLEPNEVQDLFCTGWLDGPTAGLCIWNGKTYYYNWVQPEKGTRYFYLFKMDLREIVFIEKNHKHICGMRDAQNDGKFRPTLRLSSMLPKPGTLGNNITWLVKNIKGARYYSEGKAPVAIWRRYG